MDTTDGKTKELLGRKFKTVKNGLDEAEVFDFLGGLIEQNKKLTLKLDHLESLTRLAERTVIEAGKEAENIKRETLEKANSQASDIVTQGKEKAKTDANSIIAEAQRKAEEQTREIIKSAEGKAETITAQANEDADKIIANAKQNATAMEQQAQETIKNAEVKAAQVKEDADKKALNIISEAKEKAEEVAKARIESVEKEARHIINEAKEKAEGEARHIINEAKERAEREALLIKQKSEQLLKKSKKIAEEEIKDKLKKVYQGLLSNLEGIDEATIIPSMEEKEEAKLSEHEEDTAAVAEATTMSEEPVGQPHPSQNGKTTLEREVHKGSSLYDGIVELIIPPPLGLDRMLQLHKHLRNISNAKVLNLGVSSDKSITIRLLLERPTPLLDILAELPEIEKASESPPESAETIDTARKAGDKTPVKRILISTRK